MVDLDKMNNPRTKLRPTVSVVVFFCLLRSGGKIKHTLVVRLSRVYLIKSVNVFGRKFGIKLADRRTIEKSTHFAWFRYFVLNEY